MGKQRQFRRVVTPKNRFVAPVTVQQTMGGSLKDAARRTFGDLMADKASRALLITAHTTYDRLLDTSSLRDMLEMMEGVVDLRNYGEKSRYSANELMLFSDPNMMRYFLLESGANWDKYSDMIQSGSKDLGEISVLFEGSRDAGKVMLTKAVNNQMKLVKGQVDYYPRQMEMLMPNGKASRKVSVPYYVNEFRSWPKFGLLDDVPSRDDPVGDDRFKGVATASMRYLNDDLTENEGPGMTKSQYIYENISELVNMIFMEKGIDLNDVGRIIIYESVDKRGQSNRKPAVADKSHIVVPNAAMLPLDSDWNRYFTNPQRPNEVHRVSEVISNAFKKYRENDDKISANSDAVSALLEGDHVRDFIGVVSMRTGDDVMERLVEAAESEGRYHALTGQYMRQYQKMSPKNAAKYGNQALEVLLDCVSMKWESIELKELNASIRRLVYGISEKLDLEKGLIDGKLISYSKAEDIRMKRPSVAGNSKLDGYLMAMQTVKN